MKGCVKLRVILRNGALPFVFLSGAMASANPPSEANTMFFLALFKKISEEEAAENIFFSPFSISSALAMVMLGAKANTATQMSEVSGTCVVICAKQQSTISANMLMQAHIQSATGCVPTCVADELYCNRKKKRCGIRLWIVLRAVWKPQTENDTPSNVIAFLYLRPGGFTEIEQFGVEPKCPENLYRNHYFGRHHVMSKPNMIIRKGWIKAPGQFFHGLVLRGLSHNLDHSKTRNPPAW